MSVAREHKARILLALAAGLAVTAAAPIAGPVIKGQAGAKKTGDLMLMALEADMETLRAVEDIAQRAAMKKQMLGKYLEYLAKYRESGARHPNPVLTHCVIWLLDTDQMAEAIDLAGFAIEQQQLMPERFKRDLPTFVAESVCDWAERQFKAKHSPEPFLGDVIARIESGAWVVAQPIVIGKIYKQAGLSAELAGDTKAALAFYHQAQEANPAAGVKTRIKLLEKFGS